MNRKLRKMKKIELLEMLLEQEKEIERLQEENSQLRDELENRKLTIEKSGSIAEAALSLSGVFEAAQKAADVYLASIKPEAEGEPEAETAEGEAEEPAPEAEMAEGGMDADGVSEPGV